MPFDFEEQKKLTVKRLEAIEKIRLDYEALLKRLKELNIGELIEQAAKTEIAKIMRYAKQHDIPFTIPVEELLKQVQLPVATQADAPSNLHPSQTLPFLPDLDNSLTDVDGDEWRWDADEQEWVLAWDESSDWSNSNC
jgi:hypothetical protein